MGRLELQCSDCITLSDGDHLIVVSCEEHLGLAVLDVKQLVFADVSVLALDHGTRACRCQVLSCVIFERHSTQLSHCLHLKCEHGVVIRTVDQSARTRQVSSITRLDAVATFKELEFDQGVSTPRYQLTSLQTGAVVSQMNVLLPASTAQVTAKSSQAKVFECIAVV